MTRNRRKKLKIKISLHFLVIHLFHYRIKKVIKLWIFIVAMVLNDIFFMGRGNKPYEDLIIVEFLKIENFRNFKKECTYQLKTCHAWAQEVKQWKNQWKRKSTVATAAWHRHRQDDLENTRRRLRPVETKSLCRMLFCRGFTSGLLPQATLFYFMLTWRPYKSHLKSLQFTVGYA